MSHDPDYENDAFPGEPQETGVADSDQEKPPDEPLQYDDRASLSEQEEFVIGTLAHSLRQRLRAAPAMRSGGLLDWARHYLPTHFQLAPSAMHRWLAEQIEAAGCARGQKINVIGPRGAAKSTVASLACPLRLAVEAAEPYIWIVSDTKDQAASHLENIKAELIDNELLAEDYPDAVGKGSVWRTAAIRLRNGVMIEAFGTGQRIRGRRRRANRPTLIICDDLQNDGHIESSLQRDHSRRWFHGTLLKAGTHATNVLHLATALHHDALGLELARTPGWTSRIFRAIERWPDRMALWQEWEAIYTALDNPNCRQQARAFYEEHAAQMNAGCVLLWPEHEGLYTLMQMRVESGRTAFEREKQGSPINPEACEWPEDYFGDCIWFEDWPARLTLKIIALDPSKGHDARRGDYSAFVLLGITAEGLLYVEADLARRATPQIVADGVEWCRVFRPDALAIETNQFQDLLGHEFAAELSRQGLANVSPWSIDNRVNKLVRVRRLGPYLSRRQLRFRRTPATRLLVEQLQQFPVGDHDDGPDALEMAIRMAGELTGRPAPSDGLGNRLRLSS
ncbi:MAG TPA: phage terminase large subunit [Pirellulales bacterium]|nr:phage terminase large subunit [Pirellulales bacterium]